MSFKNEQEISNIQIGPIKVHNFCTLGKDWYTNNLSIVIRPYNEIPDYVDIDKYIKSLEGEHLIIEDVVAKVYEHIYNVYQPKYLKISSYVDDAVHSPVMVEKETPKVD